MTDTFAPGAVVDFSDLPLEKASKLLQVLGLYVFEKLMAQPSSLEWPTEWEGEGPALWKANDVWSGAGTVEPAVEAGEVPFWKTFFQRRYARRVMAGKISEAKFANHLAKEAHTRFIQDTVLGLSAELWTLAGEAAWQDIAFQHRLYREMDRRLRSEVLLAGGRPPQAFFSSRAMWVLIGLAASQPEASGTKRRKDLRKLQEPMTLLASKVALAEGWAGYWDQWLMVRALALVRRKYEFQDSPIVAALKALPLREALGTRALPRYDVPPTPFFARLRWFLGFAFAKLGHHCSQLFKKKLRPRVLALEHWFREKPEWAEPTEPSPRKT